MFTGKGATVLTSWS